MTLGTEDNPVLLPKGTYCIGDPLLLISQTEWDQALKTSDDFSNPRGFFVRGDDIFEIHAFKTDPNDVALVSEPFSQTYDILSHYIAIIREPASIPSPGTHIHLFSRPFACFQKKGVIHFGTITFRTENETLSPKRIPTRYQSRTLLDKDAPTYFRDLSEEGLEDEQIFTDPGSEDGGDL